MRTAMTISLLFLAAAAVAGVKSDKPVEAAPAAKTEVVRLKEDPRPLPRAKVSTNGPSVRCWQYGRLIFEEPVSEMPPTSGSHGQRFESQGGSFQLLDMHNASCVIK